MLKSQRPVSADSNGGDDSASKINDEEDTVPSPKLSPMSSPSHDKTHKHRTRLKGEEGAVYVSPHPQFGFEIRATDCKH
jgi:hypothetical protein